MFVIKAYKLVETYENLRIILKTPPYLELRWAALANYKHICLPKSESPTIMK